MCYKSNHSLTHTAFRQATNVPCAELLDVIFARNVTTERCKDELLLVKTTAEVVKLRTCRHILVKFFLGPAHIIGKDTL